MAVNSSHADVSRTCSAQTFRGASHICQKTRACELTKIIESDTNIAGLFVYMSTKYSTDKCEK